MWSSDISPFQLKPGDQVSVSSVAIEASSIGTPDTIEFTQNPVKVNNVQKNYIDNKVVLEIEVQAYWHTHIWHDVYPYCIVLFI
mgnify:FL=1